MKVSFKALPVRDTLKGQAKLSDLTQVVAEAVYQNAANFNEHKLAHRIAESDGELELNDIEVDAVRRSLVYHKFYIQKPILEALGDKFE